MSDTTNPELCSIITNVCKPPKDFDFKEAEQSCSFVWFEQFRWVYYFWWEDKTYCLPCVLFGHKNVGKSLEKNDSKNRKQQKKTFKKFQNVPTRTQKNRQILLHRFLGGGGVDENSKNWVGAGTNF